jgi:hypothetical protein
MVKDFHSIAESCDMSLKGFEGASFGGFDHADGFFRFCEMFQGEEGVC